MKSIDAKLLVKMFESGAKLIANKCEYMNELNVFPVPDGDTGTNMKITTNSTIDYIKANVDVQNQSLYNISKVIARQLLMNARGNSGVIFSQIFRGFFDPIKEDDTDINIEKFIECLKAAKDKAYKSISNPIEGTILTIIRIVVEDLENTTFNEFEDLFQHIIKSSLKALKLTPSLLPSLKEAKVVDSGGYGLCSFFEGMYLALTGDETLNDEIKTSSDEINIISTTSKNTFINNKARNEIIEEGFGYCCEFIIETTFKTSENQKNKLKWTKNEFEKELLEIGDSLIIINDEDIIKIHMHSLFPNKVLEIGQKYGEFLKIKIENMTKQFLDNHPEITQDELFKKYRMTNDIKVVATLPTKMLSEYYAREFNVNNTIITEKNGNPSTNDILIAMKNANSTNVLIVTDDSNIILSAEQAAILYKDKASVQIAKCKNTMESFFACETFNPNISLDENYKEINKVLKKSITGLISNSVKTAKFNNVLVEKGDFIGIIDKKIMLADKNSEQAAISLIKQLLAKIKKPQIVYLIHGSLIKLREIRNIEKVINESFGLKCKIIDGNQSLYHYLIGVH